MQAQSHIHDVSRSAAMHLIGIAPEEIQRSFVPLLADCLEVVDADGAVLFIASEGKRSLQVQQFWRSFEDGATELPSKLSSHYKSTLREAILQGEPYELSASHFSAEPSGEERLLFERVGIRSLLSLPLKKDGVVLGALAFIMRGRLIRWQEDAWTAIDEFGFIFTRLLARLSPVTKRIQELRSLIGGDAENVFHVVIDSLNEGVSCCTNDGLVVYCNPSWEAITGYSLEETRGKRIYEFLFPPMTAAYDRLKTRQHERYEERRRGIPEEYETEIVRKDGRRCWIQVQASPLRNQELEVVGSIGIVTDITERKVLETQLFWSQKMEAVGRVAEGVAAQFQNTLQILTEYREMLGASAKGFEENAQARESLEKAARSASRIVQQLAAVTRTPLGQIERISAQEIVDRSRDILLEIVGEDVALIFLSEGTKAEVEVDWERIQQALMNLVLNAREAASAGGRIEIQVSEGEVTGSQFSLSSGLVPGRYATISVCDDGPGMNEEVREKLFEPFFTTKPSRSGLGLSVAYGILRQHEGAILVDSDVGRGARLRMYLPLVPEGSNTDSAS